MKIIRFTAISLLIFLLFSLAVSCDGDQKSEELYGSYEGDFEGSAVTLTLEKNLTGTLAEKNGVSYDLTYTVDGDNLTITLAGQSKAYLYSLDDGALKLSANDQIFTLRK